MISRPADQSLGVKIESTRRDTDETRVSLLPLLVNDDSPPDSIAPEHHNNRLPPAGEINQGGGGGEGVGDLRPDHPGPQRANFTGPTTDEENNQDEPESGDSSSDENFIFSRTPTSGANGDPSYVSQSRLYPRTHRRRGGRHQFFRNCIMMDHRYLSPQQIKGFEHYKYSSIDTSPLSNYVMHPFWNQCVKLVPMWVAPNLLTFIGFMLTVANALLLSYYDYSFGASSADFPQYPPIPHWVWAVCALNHFLAHTLDGIDGKQARRTKSSGPLGELFDHGLDSWTSLMIPFCIYSLFGRADYALPPIRVLFIFWTIFMTFHLSHWEKYNTGVLYLPWSYDISQLLLFVLYIVSAVHGADVWKFRWPVLELSNGEAFEILSYVGSFGLSVPVTLFNVYLAWRAGTHKQRDLWEAMRPLAPFTILFLLTTGWAVYSPNGLLEADPRCFFFMVGTIFSNIATRLIVSQMSSTRCETLNWLLVPLSAIIVATLILPPVARLEMAVLYLFTAYVTLVHIHYGVCVVRQMCRHFRKRCFSL